MTDASHETVDRSQLATDMTVDEASKELLQLLPGDTDLEEGEEELPDAQDHDESEDKAGKDAEDADKPDDTEVDDPDEQDGEDQEDVEVFVLPLPDGKEEEVTLEELVASRLRQSDYTRKTQKLADDRRGMESELAETRTVRSEYAERVTLLNKTLNDMSPEVDWDQVKRDDPDGYPMRYADHQRQEAKRETLRVEARRVEEEAATDAAAHRSKFLAEERKLLAEAIPDFADPEKSKALITELADYAEAEFGVDRGQFDEVHNHLILRLLNDSMKLKQLQSKTKTIRKKIVKGKRVVTPGSRPAGSTVHRKTVRRTKSAFEKLAKTGEVKDAADLILSMDLE